MKKTGFLVDVKDILPIYSETKIIKYVLMYSQLNTNQIDKFKSLLGNIVLIEFSPRSTIETLIFNESKYWDSEVLVIATHEWIVTNNDKIKTPFIYGSYSITPEIYDFVINPFYMHQGSTIYPITYVFEDNNKQMIIKETLIRFRKNVLQTIRLYDYFIYLWAIKGMSKEYQFYKYSESGKQTEIEELDFNKVRQLATTKEMKNNRFVLHFKRK